MNIHELSNLLWQQIRQTDILQWLAVTLGIAEVMLARVNNIGLYPAGIAATVLSIFILWSAGLYAECLLNGYYIIMSIYGWWYWVKKKEQPPLKIAYCNRREWITVVLIVTGGFVFLSVILHYFTPSTVPLADAWISATAWAGMWLLAKRKIENWILLNISNLFAIPLLFYKQLPLYAALTIFLFIVAINGYIKWSRIIRKENNGVLLAVN